jgi:hypothetical protein
MEAPRTKISESFTLLRFGLLLRRDFSLGYKSVVIAMLAVGGFVILWSVVSALSRQLTPMHQGLYGLLLFVGGFAVTSLAFKELHLEAQNIFYLTLPGSSLEKFLSKLLVTSIGYAVGSLLFYTAVSSAAEGINRLIFGYGHPFFDPFARNVLLALAIYLVSQSIFLLGSVYFRKLAFVKTSLYLVLLGIAFSIVTGVAMWFVFRDYATGTRILFEPYLNELGQAGDLEAVVRPLAERFFQVVKVLFWAALAPVCWLISYLRLRETEV